MPCFVLGEVDLCNVVPHRKTFFESVTPACWPLMALAQLDLCVFLRNNQNIYDRRLCYSKNFYFDQNNKLHGILCQFFADVQTKKLISQIMCISGITLTWKMVWIRSQYFQLNLNNKMKLCKYSLVKSTDECQPLCPSHIYLHLEPKGLFTCSLWQD